MPVGFNFTKITVIESLEPFETKTGQLLAQYLEVEVERLGLRVEVDFRTCRSANEFERILEALELEARDGIIPIVHVECHGDKLDGLEFENGSTLAWDRLASGFLPLNVTTRFNTMAVVSACFGGYFLGMMGAVKPSPCYGVVAPTDTVMPSELLRGFKAFYTKLLETLDAGKAESLLIREQLSRGRWFAQIAELWFEKLLLGYAKTYCSKKSTHVRARKLYRQLKKAGQASHLGNLKRQLKRRNRENLLNEYFRRYFLIDQIPENDQRFAEVRDRMGRALADLRGTGLYIL